MYLSSEGNFGLRRSCTEVRRPTFWWFCANPGIPPQIPQKRDYTHSVNFLRLSSIYKAAVLFGGCFSRVWGGLLRKTAVSGAMSGLRVENTCYCSYCCKSTENGDLAWIAKAQLKKIYCHRRDTNLSWSWICAVYHVLRRCTRGDNRVYLHRAAPRATGHRRCVESYDRASSTV